MSIQSAAAVDYARRVLDTAEFDLDRLRQKDADESKIASAEQAVADAQAALAEAEAEHARTPEETSGTGEAFDAVIVVTENGA